MSWLTNLLNGGLFGSIENITKELIDTPLEKAQAQVLKVSKDVCSNCGDVNNECVELRLLWVFKYKLCQRCVSKAFRSFVKGK
jgi:3-methyladenine DNA glycosylase AlkC